MNYQFKPKWWSIILAMAFVFIFVKLGLWQLSRADEKIARHEKIEQSVLEPVILLPATKVKLEEYQYRRVEVHGHLIEEQAIYLDNKVFQGRVGYEIIAPLKILNSDVHVLINRGWIASDGNRMHLPEVLFPENEITVTGLIVSPNIKAMQLSKEIVSGKLWTNLDFELYKDISGLSLQPILLLQQDNHLEDGLIRQWSKPDSGASKNIGYAIQWFLLALTVCIIFIILNVKRNSTKEQN